MIDLEDIEEPTLCEDSKLDTTEDAFCDGIDSVEEPSLFEDSKLDESTEDLSYAEPSLLDSIDYLMSDTEDKVDENVDVEITFNLQKSLRKSSVPGPDIIVDEDTIPDLDPMLQRCLPSQDRDESDNEEVDDEMFQTCLENDASKLNVEHDENEDDDYQSVFDETLKADENDPDEDTRKGESIGDESLKSANVPDEDDYEDNDDYDYEEDEDYDEEISKLENQIDNMKQKAESTLSVPPVSKDVNLSSKKRPAEDDLEDPAAKKHKNEDDESVLCLLCDKSSKNAQEVLLHLSTSHFPKELWGKYPLETEETCKICIQEDKKRKFVMKDPKQRGHYMYHVGKVHYRALEFLEAPLQAKMIQMLNNEPSSKTNVPETFHFLPELPKLTISLEESSQAMEVTEPSNLIEEESTAPTLEVKKEKKKSRKSTIRSKEVKETTDDVQDESLAETTVNTNADNPDEKVEPVTEEGNPESQSLDVEKKVKRRSTGPSLKCSICDNKEEPKLFTRSTLLLHLSTTHFCKVLIQNIGKEIGATGETCKFCLQDGKSKKKLFQVVSSMAQNMRHVGSVHEKVLDCIPRDANNKEMLDALMGGENEEPRIIVHDNINTNNEEESAVNIVVMEPASSSIPEESKSTKEDLPIPDESNYPVEERLTIPEESNSPVEEEFLPKSKSPRISNRKSNDGAKIISCSLCDKDEPKFSKFRLLEHLSMVHFSKQLNEKFSSLFKDNEQCQHCLQQNKNPGFMMKTKGAFLRHLGATHKVCLEFIPLEDKHLTMKETLGDNVDKKEIPSQIEDVKTLDSNVEKLAGDAKEVDESINLTLPVDKPKKKETKIPRKKSKLNETEKVDNKDQQSVINDDLNPKRRFSRMPKFQPIETDDKPVLKKPKITNKVVPQSTPDLPDPINKLSSMITVEKKTFQCGECPSILASKLELMKHMRSHIRK